MNKQDTLERILRELATTSDEVRGALLATPEGLPIVSTLPDPEVPRLAAMAATVVGLSAKVADTVGAGGYLETVIRGEDGYLAVYDLGDRAALAVATRPGVNLGLLHLEARSAARQVVEILA
jgi:predicted regulator of Ras-like GTPase activity (Roadblock/LC7/MglB family)